MRSRFIVAIVLCAIGLAACDDSPGGTTSPGAGQSTVTPGPGQISPDAYLIPPATMAAYSKVSSTPVSAQQLAVQEGSDPSLLTSLTGEGYENGTQVVYQQPLPAKTVTSFFEVDSRAYIFNGAGGATKFFNDESERYNQVSTGGTITEISNPPHTNADALLALQEVNPPPTPPVSPGMPESRAYVAVVRHGRVVVELFGRINTDQTTTNDFTALLTAQERVLAS